MKLQLFAYFAGEQQCVKCFTTILKWTKSTTSIKLELKQQLRYLDKIGVKAATQITYTWVANTSQITLNKVSKIHEVDVEEAGTCLEEEIPFYKHHFTALDKCQESGKIIELGQSRLQRCDDSDGHNGVTADERLLISSHLGQDADTRDL
ncbi:hypothetical protein DAPPUDRAFT_117185 [Daphnia pulex]|uniref:Uncharacterized protein n=1 Tax=Daphnia pulex TaxID=6669 RepID=E9HRT5_DAPPU|nr:hypothetical protein DAPPUDRAFT_117185 [Daphnia pulex]|eukprot:EFX65562.1 hypothetical protein DAPPUDRAFT_117185 [Daphnia pulex]